MKQEEFLQILERRFKQHPERHPTLDWALVRCSVLNSPRLEVLIRMEESEGEVDVVKLTEQSLHFFDCAAEAPACRRSLCYDEAAWQARKANKPQTSAEKMAREIGAELLDEADYLYLQSLGDFDQKTQVWLQTKAAFRAHGDALFGNKRYGRTFIYYNGVQSYYAARGFRCKLEIALLPKA